MLLPFPLFGKNVEKAELFAWKQASLLKGLKVLYYT
jgi:hypothetical protein